MRSHLLLVLLLACLAAQSLAMPNRQKLFSQPCSLVWKAAIAEVKAQQYRIVSISDEERMISVRAGGWWAGERHLSLSLAEVGETQCMVTAQSRFSGFGHHDGPDLLVRIGEELRRETENSQVQPPAKEHMQDWWQKPADEKKQ